MNLRHFPVDTQICKFLIGSCEYLILGWISGWIGTLLTVANSASDVQYGWRLGNNQSVSFDTKVLLSQFDLVRFPQYDEIIEMNGRMYTVHYCLAKVFLWTSVECDYLQQIEQACATRTSNSLMSRTGNFSMLRVDFVLKRHMGYYILQVYIPSSMLVMLSWVSFFIHREATADRVNIGVMTFLSLATLSFDLRNYTAVVSYLTALDWFLIMAYGFLLASLLQFAFVHYFTKVRDLHFCLCELMSSKPRSGTASRCFATEVLSIVYYSPIAIHERRELRKRARQSSTPVS
jgi:hypothetical protein